LQLRSCRLETIATRNPCDVLEIVRKQAAARAA